MLIAATPEQRARHFTKQAAFPYSSAPPYYPNYASPRVPRPSVPFTMGENGSASAMATNPRMFNNSWDLYQYPKDISWMHSAPRMTMGASLGLMGRGFGRQMGDYAQMAFTGHQGGTSVLGNLRDDFFNTITGHPPSLASLGKSFTKPFQRALPNLREDWRLTGQPGEFLSNQFSPGYQRLKNWWHAPTSDAYK